MSYSGMVESGSGMLLTRLCLFISVLQIITRESAEGKSVILDVSGIRINPLECYDRTKSCAKQADNGYCQSNYHYMVDRCPWSCRFCRRTGGDTEKCEDISENCSEWVSKKECTTRPDFMAQNCKKSCEMCGPESDYNATDTESTCPLWAKAGWCQTNADLLEKCPHSCQKYGVQGASSLDERYITVDFENASSGAAPAESKIVAPPPPSAALSSHSELDSLPSDLRAVLANEWWNSKLLKLTQKQNEYVTHPEARPVSLPLPPRESNLTAWTGNSTLETTQGDQRVRNSTGSAISIDRSEQGDMLATSASAPPPKAYDSLLPQLFLSGGPTWNPNEHGNTISASQDTQEVWKEEKEEDEDLNESGQQKGEVPIVELGKGEEHSGDHDMDMEISSSGSGEVNQEGNNDGEMMASGEIVKNDADKMQQNTTVIPFSGSGEVTEGRNDETEMETSGKTVASGEENMEGEPGVSNVRDKNKARRHRINDYKTGSGQYKDSIKIVLPENSFSGSEELAKEETTPETDLSSSGSAQFDWD